MVHWNEIFVTGEMGECFADEDPQSNRAKLKALAIALGGWHSIKEGNDPTNNFLKGIKSLSEFSGIRIEDMVGERLLLASDKYMKLTKQENDNG